MTDQRVYVETSLNVNFLQVLEYILSKAFRNSNDHVLKYFWCDGIDKPVINEQFTNRNITSINKVATQAWIGPNGQDRFQMTIKLGPCSRRKVLKGLDLHECLPNAESLDWVEIDTQKFLILL
ncbi:hypothetical protein [Mucilaginibacter segetis]|uniref:Uncharacterized protein n=1 Tax=Mucilaginibacter segetis TaxID=2793071 RepID=A0A934UNB6_9SPHI|nr:hypothetical protein [Mucilaginibacter segetis]MBK0379731.1 hypothetical protein [Mucilaginibacter segetis]